MMGLILWVHTLSLHAPILLLSWNCNLLKWFKHITFNKQQRKRLELLTCHHFFWVHDFFQTTWWVVIELFQAMLHICKSYKTFTLVKIFGYKGYLTISDLMFYFHIVHNFWKFWFLLGHHMYKHASLTKSYNFYLFIMHRCPKVAHGHICFTNQLIH
jgi:hypothetical protein